MQHPDGVRLLLEPDGRRPRIPAPTFIIILGMLRFAFLLLALTPQAFAQAGRPNILFLFADDQRPDTIAAWGNPHIRTPNIDRLVDNGFSFRRNYCMGANGGAVCVPSRAMLNSGKAFFRIPMDLRGEKLLGELLGENGYATFATGKWHNREPSWLRSFQRGKSIMFGGMSNHTNVPVKDLGPDGRLVDPGYTRKFSSRLFADAAIKFLKSQQGEQPFFAYVAFTAPHDPRQPPRRYREMYYKSRPPLPPNFRPQHPFNNGHMRGRDEELAAWPRTREVVSDQLAEYYGLITHLDEQIGRILKVLEKTGRAENTVIIYAADHGLAVGSHGLLGKQNVYEHSMGAPLIISGPGVPKGGSSHAFTYLLDLFPTILGMASVKPPADIDGHDLRPVWEGKTKQVRDSIFLSFRHIMRSVRDEHWKLIRYPHINHTQLFDLESDPHEMKSLAGDPAQAGRIERMMAMIGEWQQKVGDTQALTSQNSEPKEIDMSGQPRNVDRWQPMWIIEKYFPEWF